jgi:hypothetical protein
MRVPLDDERFDRRGNPEMRLCTLTEPAWPPSMACAAVFRSGIAVRAMTGHATVGYSVINSPVVLVTIENRNPAFAMPLRPRVAKIRAAISGGAMIYTQTNLSAFDRGELGRMTTFVSDSGYTVTLRCILDGDFLAFFESRVLCRMAL